MEKKVGFKLHKVKKNWVTIGVSTLSMVALAGGAFLTDQSAKADEVPVPNKGGYEQSDAGIESSASLVNQSYTPTLTEDATYVSAVPSNSGSQMTARYEASSSYSTEGSSASVIGAGVTSGGEVVSTGQGCHQVLHRLHKVHKLLKHRPLIQQHLVQVINQVAVLRQ